MSQIASFILAYLMVGVLVWIAIPTVKGASGNRPKFLKCVVAWGPAVLGGSGSSAHMWMWKKDCRAEDEGIENGDHNGV